jgi:ParB/RepB/Spo0J family partition protein
MIELAEDPTPPAPPGEDRYEVLLLDQVEPGPWNRRHFEKVDLSLEELAGSIRTKGVIAPITVRRHPDTADRYQIVAGERRWRASQLAGRPDIPCIIRALTSDEAREICVIENLQRKDLAAIEEAQGVALLLAREGATPESVALEIGRAEAWVAQRYSIAMQLSEKWQKAVLDLESPFGQLTAGHLIVVSRMPVEIQDRLLEADIFWTWNPRDHRKRMPVVPTIDGLRRWAERYQRNLNTAPWKLADADLVPEAGPCTTCPKRSGAALLLWDESELEDHGPDGRKRKKPADHCLDPACWQTKVEALIDRAAAEAKSEYGEVIFVTDGSGYGSDPPARYPGAKRRYNLLESSGPAEGFVPCIVVDGHDAGRFFFGRSQATGSRPDEPKGPTPLKERRKQLKRRRERTAIENLFALVRGVKEVPDLSTVARLAACVGLDVKVDRPAGGHDDFWPWKSAYHDDLPADPVPLEEWRAKVPESGHVTWARFDILDDDRTAAVLWRWVLNVFAGRLQYAPNWNTGLQWLEVTRLAEIVDINPVPIWEAAVEGHPEPKSWERLNEDGTPKTKAEPSKKRAARAEPPAGTGSEATLFLTDIQAKTDIPYPTLSRLFEVHSAEIPHEMKGRYRYFPVEAVVIFQRLAADAKTSTAATPPPTPEPSKRARTKPKAAAKGKKRPKAKRATKSAAGDPE